MMLDLQRKPRAQRLLLSCRLSLIVFFISGYKEGEKTFPKNLFILLIAKRGFQKWNCVNNRIVVTEVSDHFKVVIFVLSCNVL